MTDRLPGLAAHFRIRSRGYDLAAEVADYLASLDGENAALVRDAQPDIHVEESGVSASTYVYLGAVCARISDHPAGNDSANCESEASAMIEAWLADVRADLADAD
jgi:hypothetical protein